MCPLCIANIAVLAAGTTSGGGVAVFAFSKFYTSGKQPKTESNHNRKTNRKEKGRRETFQNRVAERVGGSAPTIDDEGEEITTREK